MEFSMQAQQTIDAVFNGMIEAVGSKPNQEQVDNLVSYAIKNYGQEYWSWCADRLLSVGNAYTQITERLGECGMY